MPAMSAALSTTHRSQTLPASLNALQVTSSPKSKHSRLPPVIPSLVQSRGFQRRVATVADDAASRRAAAGTDYLHAPRSTLSPLTSPRHDVREDPFSLNSFFPSRPSSPSAEPLSWLSPTEETVQEVEEEGEEEEAGVEAGRNAERGGIPPLRSLSLTALDDYAREVIAKEDHLGILSLVRIPFFFKRHSVDMGDDDDDDELDVPVTPTAMVLDEPYDDETLYETLCSRRAAASARLGSVPLPGTEHAADGLGTLSLFSPTAETREAELGWANALYAKMLGDH